MSVRKLRALRPGDTLSMVSPASPLTPEQTAKAVRLLESEGYHVKLYPSTYAANDYLAGSDVERAKDLIDALRDPETQAVYCSRGGYGCSRLVPYLNFDELAQTDKMLIGFSDVTVLHAAFNRRGTPTVHAPMGLTLHTDRQPWVYESFKATLRGESPIPATAPKGKCLVPGTAEGELVGGCMILMCDLIGTPEQIDMTDKVVLIEDVDELPHRVDAMLTHLINSGSIQKAKGLVIGEMTRTDDKIDPTIGGRAWREIVAERIKPLGIPTMIDFPCGHAPQMLSLPLGVNVRINTELGELEYLESICETK
jgi:muramoyltetrapeptide carboxypeptidase